MRRKKHEMVEEYELLYEKYQQIMADEWGLASGAVSDQRPTFPHLSTPQYHSSTHINVDLFSCLFCSTDVGLGWVLGRKRRSARHCLYGSFCGRCSWSVWSRLKSCQKYQNRRRSHGLWCILKQMLVLWHDEAVGRCLLQSGAPNPLSI